MNKGLMLLLAGILTAPLLATNAPAKTAVSSSTVATANGRYVVVLEQPSLVERMRATEKSLGLLQTEASILRDTDGRLELNSDRARAELSDLDQQFESFLGTINARLGRDLSPDLRYRMGLNGFAVELTAQEANSLAAMDGVRSVREEEFLKLQTDAGPRWVGAERVWQGAGDLTANRGAGVVVGVVDSGINWNHPSFQDPGATGAGYDHQNPYGSQLGLCSDPEVLCNDKLVGVYDFVEDNPSTEFEENFNNGFDDGDHGAHTAGTAAGNPVNYVVNGAPVSVSGVAPNANIISYRVCHRENPDEPDEGTCAFSWILAALDQAIADGVDVINYSLGGTARDPWASSDAILFLNAFESGVFIATSAGNAGRDGASSVGAPGNAPWMTSVGAATHDRIIGGVVSATQGGNTTPPGSLFGETLTTQNLSTRDIVYAGDFGNALCGTGPSEGGAECSGFDGSSNPFPPNTFNGEIVVCDRGDYGRVEKGHNLLEAGAGGYILANVPGGDQSTVPDEHCLPALHVNSANGEALRDWLSSGSNHQASLSGFAFRSDPSSADRIADFSSRGPALDPVQDILKPNVIAPGVAIFAADNESTDIVSKDGTSMSSPHVAGAAALIIADRPGLTPAQVGSMLELSATDENAKNTDFGPVDHFDTGAGRIQVDQAIQLGVYLDETADNFRFSNPLVGGEPRDLNLASLTDASCLPSCSFTREIGSFVNGVTWNTSVSGLPPGVQVTVTPQNFTLNAGQTREITVNVDTTGGPRGEWVFGKINISNPNYPTAVMPLSVLPPAVSLPDEFFISTRESSGFEDFDVGGINALSGAVYETGGLQEAEITVFDLVEDPTNGDPFDGGDGVVAFQINVPANALLLHADTQSFESQDVDLYVGRDTNGNGQAELGEVECVGGSPDATEACDITNPASGSWWIVVQNWDDGQVATPGPAQEITLSTALITPASNSSLTVTGPGIADDLEEFRLRFSWDNLSTLNGETLWGAVRIINDPSNPGQSVVVPVRMDRTAIDLPDARPLFDGQEAAFAMRTNSTAQFLFIDVPPGVTSLDVQAAGRTVAQNNALSIELVRQPFDNAFANAPGVTFPSGTAPTASGSGSGGQGPRATINGGVNVGRWFVVVRNNASSLASVRLTANLEHSGTPVDVFGGLWQPASRPGINQGFEYTPAGNNRALLWYTYDQDGSPMWYIASAGATDNNTWTSDLFRFTNDGTNQAGTRVGTVGVTMLDAGDAIMSWTLFGVSGSDRAEPLSRSCPESVSPVQSFTGLWYRGTDGLGGASIVANRTSQAHIHYLYDGNGQPRWVLAAGSFADSILPMTQFSGFCPTCTGNVTSQVVGSIGVSYADNATGEWDLDVDFVSPASGSIIRNDDIVRLSNTLSCVQ